MRIQSELSMFELGTGYAVLFKDFIGRFIDVSHEISTKQIIEKLKDDITDITSLAREKLERKKKRKEKDFEM